MHGRPTIDLKEAANFLGFKNTSHLREKAKSGQIPGAFKVSNRWMFLMDELVEFVRNFYKSLSDAGDTNVKRSETWQLAKRKTAHSTTRDSLSAESECRNLLDALQKEKRKNMKKNGETK